MRFWRKHFPTLLQGDGDTNTALRDDVPKPINDDNAETLPPSHEEVKVAIMGLKNNESAGLRPKVMCW